MPYDEADPTDPMLLLGVEVPGDETSNLEAVRAIAEEFARMGYSEEQLLSVFREPFYGGAHRAYLALGEEAVQAVVRESVRFWGRVRFRECEPGEVQGMILLPVLEAPPAPPRRCEDV